MRPDILLFERDSDDTPPLALQDLEHIENKRRYKVHVVEVGFCTELAYAEKVKKNMSNIALCWNPSEMQAMLMSSCMCSFSGVLGECSHSRLCI